ncbi:MAG: hypothetical protein ACWA6R_11080 [Nitrosomonas sp.]
MLRIDRRLTSIDKASRIRIPALLEAEVFSTILNSNEFNHGVQHP